MSYSRSQGRGAHQRQSSLHSSGLRFPPKARLCPYKAVLCDSSERALLLPVTTARKGWSCSFVWSVWFFLEKKKTPETYFFRFLGLFFFFSCCSVRAQCPAMSQSRALLHSPGNTSPSSSSYISLSHSVRDTLFPTVTPSPGGQSTPGLLNQVGMRGTGPALNVCCRE